MCASGPPNCPRAVGLMRFTASLPWGNGQWNSCGTLLHCLGAQGSGTFVVHCRTALGQWAMELSRYTAALNWVSGQLITSSSLSHCLGTVHSGAPSGHCLTALGKWAVELLPRGGSRAGSLYATPPSPPPPPPGGFER